MTKINSNRKGKIGELEFAKLCRDNGYKDCRRGQQYNGLEGEDVVGLPNVHIEVKRTERFKIYDAIEQVKRDTKDDRLPIVAHRRNESEWLVVMTAKDWFKMYRESEAGQVK